MTDKENPVEANCKFSRERYKVYAPMDIDNGTRLKVRESTSVQTPKGATETAI